MKIIVSTWNVDPEDRANGIFTGMRYLVVPGRRGVDEHMIIFLSLDSTHAQIAQKRGKCDPMQVLGAGHIHRSLSGFDPEDFRCEGESLSLKEAGCQTYWSREQDTKILQDWLSRGFPQGG